MKVQDISSESNLREWITEHHRYMSDVSLQWVEPGLYGSSIGAGDLILKHGESKVDIELKYLFATKKGIKFPLRPAQRRFHHMSMRRGGKTCLLAVVSGPHNVLFLVRGDKIPLRDYASHPDSGCKNHEVERYFLDSTHDELAMKRLRVVLFFDNNFWR